jgi:hypothetical protein
VGRGLALIVLVGCGRIAFDPNTPNIDAPTVDAPRPSDVCPTYAPVAGYPRHVLRGTGQSWDGAFASCEATGGRLLVPLAQVELDAIFAAFGADLGWVGLTDADIEGTFVAPAAPDEVPYFDWLANEPNNGGGAGVEEDCVFVYTDGYNDQGCGTASAYICECDVAGAEL